MKNLLKLTLLALLLVSCNFEDKKVADVILHEKEQIEKSEKPLQTELKKLEKELLKKTLLTDEELLQAFPQNLMGFQLDKVSTIPGMAQVYGQFNKGKISLSIADAAGNRNTLATTFVGNYSYIPPASDKSKSIKIERDGIKTVSKFKYNETEMSLLFDNRYIIFLNVKALNPDEVWQAFDITLLKGYKEKNK